MRVSGPRPGSSMLPAKAWEQQQTHVCVRDPRLNRQQALIGGVDESQRACGRYSNECKMLLRGRITLPCRMKRNTLPSTLAHNRHPSLHRARPLLSYHIIQL